MPMAPGAGGSKATSGAATSPRRSWPRSSSSSPHTTHSGTTRRSGRISGCCSSGSPDARRRCTARTGSPQAVEAEATRLGGSRAGVPRLRLYLKREDLAHTGAHKINNALGQALLTRRLGKRRVIAETGAGQHGVATATACALLDLPCVVYMGAEDIERQGPNVLRMKALGAEVRPVTSGTATLKDAVNEAMRDWVTNVESTHYVLGSAMGPHPYPTIVKDLQRRIGDEAAAQLQLVEGRLPDLALACVGGGSNAIGLLARFIGEPTVRLAVSEAAGDGMDTGRHAAAILGGTIGILHGSRSLMLQDADGQVIEAHSASAGLDYPGIGPQLAALAEAGRIEVAAATDREAVAAMRATTRTEGILPALETSHAIAALPKLLAGGRRSRRRWPDETLVLLGFSGRGDKDLAALSRFADVEPWEIGSMTDLLDRPDGPALDARGTNETAGRTAHRRRLRASERRGPRGAHPVRRRGLPRCRDEPADRPGRGGRRGGPARGGSAVLRPAGRWRDTPACVGGCACRRRDPRAIAAPHRADRRRAPRPAARPDGLRQPGLGGGDGTAVARRLAKAGAAGVIVADLTPDEGLPFEAVAREAGIAVVYLVAPTTPPVRRVAIAARTGGFLYCVSLVGVTGARASLPRSVGRLVRDVRGGSPVPVAVGLRGQPSRPRPVDREGWRRWGDRRVGPRRRARPGWPECRWARTPRSTVASRHDPEPLTVSSGHGRTRATHG